MDTKKLAKLIKVIVEAEVAKKQEQFLSKTFPKILEEEVNRRVKKYITEMGSPTNVEVEQDPFKLAESVLQKERQVQQKKIANNPTINEILNQTQPFTSAERNPAGGIGGGSSVLDKFQTQPLNEVSSHVPNYMNAEPDIDETINFSSINGQAGVESMRAQMAVKMGYGDMNSTPNKGGLGVTTGLAGLDRILNRDNSELVKRFKK